MDNQLPRYCIAPKVKGATDEVGVTAISLAEEYGLTLDPWQANVVRTWMRTQPNGKWCASSWGVSVSRQNGKNAALEAVEFYMMAVLGLKIVHTAHNLSAARKAFKRLQRFFGRTENDPNAEYPELNALVKEIRKTNSQESIVLTNGGLIELSARSSNAARGSSYDVLVVDEGQEYEEDEQEALEPVVSASATGQPVIIYMGTPPREVSERGAPFVRIRNGAVTGTNKRIAWVEHSAPGELDKMSEPELAAFVHDRNNWYAANPGIPRNRPTIETIEDECGKWTPRSFARERLNMFPSPQEAGAKAFNMDRWEKLKDEEPDSAWQVAAFGVDMNIERTSVSIGVATFRDDDRIHLELAADAPFDESGTSALVEWLWERCKRRVPVVIDAFSPARDILEVPLKKRGMSVFVLDAKESTQSCGLLHLAVGKEASVTHFGQEHLDEAVRHTVKEPVKNRPGVFKWNRDSLEVDLRHVMAITAAHFGALKFARKRKSQSEQKKRYAVVG